LVVEALLGGPQRVNDLLGQIPGIAANILSERLKRLERERLLIVRPYSERPPRAAYQLTAEGTERAAAAIAGRRARARQAGRSAARTARAASAAAQLRHLPRRAAGGNVGYLDLRG
jgi:DNA-binding HxlR family transcriptional regulator